MNNVFIREFCYLSKKWITTSKCFRNISHKLAKWKVLYLVPPCLLFKTRGEVERFLKKLARCRGMTARCVGTWHYFCQRARCLPLCGRCNGGMRAEYAAMRRNSHESVFEIIAPLCSEASMTSFCKHWLTLTTTWTSSHKYTQYSVDEITYPLPNHSGIKVNPR